MSSSWRPSADVAPARRRAEMLARARRFFADRAILEVDTPLLSRTTVTDPQIQSIGAELAMYPGTPWFLQTSPEYFMKRLLASGYPDIFQVCKAFRDAEAGRRHQPEFTLVEWYRRGFELARMMEETTDFIAALIDPRHLGAAPRLLEYYRAFQEHAGVDAANASIDSLANAANADRRMHGSLGDDRDAWLDLVLSTRVVPHFDEGRLTVLYHYPASQAVLARSCPQDAALADRFEVFYGDLELANGYVELVDPGEQLRRFETDREKRRRRGLSDLAFDRHLLAALESGLPDCAGVAVGFDRLLMINEMSEDIASVQSFAFF